MSIGEAGYPGELCGDQSDAGVGLMRLISQAVLGAMIEDWAVESMELYRASEEIVATRQLPDDTIEPGSEPERLLMEWLAGDQHLLDALAPSVRDFLSLVVSGSRVLEEETAFCRVVWVSRGGGAEPVFYLPAENANRRGIRDPGRVGP